MGERTTVWAEVRGWLKWLGGIAVLLAATWIVRRFLGY